jgi:hypothetical protein
MVTGISVLSSLLCWGTSKDCASSPIINEQIWTRFSCYSCSIFSANSIFIIIIIIITLFSRMLILTLIFLGIIINLLPLYRPSYFVFCSFNYFCVFICTSATLQLASVLLSMHVNKHELN